MTELSVEMGSDLKIKSVTRLPPQPMTPNSTWMNQKVLFLTNLFGKNYYWLRDIDGTHYLARMGSDGLPDLS